MDLPTSVFTDNIYFCAIMQQSFASCFYWTVFEGILVFKGDSSGLMNDLKKMFSLKT